MDVKYHPVNGYRKECPYKNTFYDVRTSTCMDCSNVCGARFNTIDECRRLCSDSDYFKTTSSTTTVTTTSTVITPPVDNAGGRSVVMISLSVSLLILIIVSGIGCIYYANKCRQRKAWDCEANPRFQGEDQTKLLQQNQQTQPKQNVFILVFVKIKVFFKYTLRGKPTPDTGSRNSRGHCNNSYANNGPHAPINVVTAQQLVPKTSEHSKTCSPQILNDLSVGSTPPQARSVSLKAENIKHSSQEANQHDSSLDKDSKHQVKLNPGQPISQFHTHDPKKVVPKAQGKPLLSEKHHQSPSTEPADVHLTSISTTTKGKPPSKPGLQSLSTTRPKQLENQQPECLHQSDPTPKASAKPSQSARKSILNGHTNDPHNMPRKPVVNSHTNDPQHISRQRPTNGNGTSPVNTSGYDTMSQSSHTPQNKHYDTRLSRDPDCSSVPGIFVLEGADAETADNFGITSVNHQDHQDQRNGMSFRLESHQSTTSGIQINLIDDSHNELARLESFDRRNPVTESFHTDHWDSVMDLYQHIEANKHKFPWIVGCMISNDHIEVMVNLEQAQCGIGDAYDQLCGEISTDKEEYLVMTSQDG